MIYLLYVNITNNRPIIYIPKNGGGLGCEILKSLYGGVFFK